MGPVRVAFDVEIRDETPRVFVGRFRLIHIDDGAKFVESEHFPGPLVVEFRPAHVLDVAEAEESILRGRRIETLPGLILIAGTAKGHDAGDFGVLREAGGCGGAVRGSGEDDFFPIKIGLVLVQKLLPLLDPQQQF